MNKEFEMLFPESRDGSGEINQKNIYEYLNDILKSKSLTKVEVMKKAKVNKNYGYQIFNGTRKPSRDKLIMLGIGMGLNLAELNSILVECNHAKLYPVKRRDAVIMYFSQKDYDVDGINEILESYGEEELK